MASRSSFRKANDLQSCRAARVAQIPQLRHNSGATATKPRAKPRVKVTLGEFGLVSALYHLSSGISGKLRLSGPSHPFKMCCIRETCASAQWRKDGRL